MNYSLKSMMRCLIFAVPVVLSGAIVTAPAQALSFASSTGELTLSNFSQEPTDLLTDATTNTIAVAEPGSFAAADAEADATASVSGFAQFSTAIATGLGSSYFSQANSSSLTKGTFTTNGLFGFNFKARLTALTLALLPGETATANSSVGFSISDSPNSTTPIDRFQINAIAANGGTTINRTSNPYVTINSFLQLTDGIGAEIEGTYSRDFGESIIFLNGTTETSVVAQVPEPSIAIPVIIVPGLIAWKQRRMAKQARSKVAIEP